MSHRVIVIGGGFGGLMAVRGLRRAPVEVVLVDRENFHLFQPLVYQVATGGLTTAEVATPLRRILRHQRNVRVVLGEVSGVDLARREVTVDSLPNGDSGAVLPYDALIVAGGSRYSYFGHDEWREHAPELKSLAGALDIRERILGAFEAAEVEPDPERRRTWLTFVVVGAGPTGVEMAGQIGELAHDVLRRDFRAADTAAARVLLVEASDRVLPAFPETLSMRAAHALERIGVTPLVGHTVVDVSGDAVSIQAPSGEIERVPARTAVWAAGVTASELATTLADGAGLEVDRAGRVPVEPDLTLPGHPEVFALGDMVSVRSEGGEPLALPGVAPVAMQQGRFAARTIRKRLAGRPTESFRYVDKGDLATIGRSQAVANIKGIHLSGFIAWLTWLVVHIAYLTGLENRYLVLVRWTTSFFSRSRGARLIVHAGEPERASGRSPTPKSS
ncbi:MAG TPA: NAD(P)/FAD-dependent oxidoreductase [Gaiellales bacterium]|nr:NAD(P)/FAD-dependent oxidoreductase [Gaiellales bacterium]